MGSQESAYREGFDRGLKDKSTATGFHLSTPSDEEDAAAQRGWEAGQAERVRREATEQSSDD